MIKTVFPAFRLMWVAADSLALRLRLEVYI